MQDRRRVRLGGRFAANCRVDELVEELTGYTDPLRHCDIVPNLAALTCRRKPNLAVRETISLIGRR
jgi:hypothetical protein